MYVAVRLGWFILLIAVIFRVAFLVGSLVGPAASDHGHGGGGGGGGGMTMSTVFSRSAPGWGGAR